jgi:hypothetical protein
MGPLIVDTDGEAPETQKSYFLESMISKSSLLVIQGMCLSGFSCETWIPTFYILYASKGEKHCSMSESGTDALWTLTYDSKSITELLSNGMRKARHYFQSHENSDIFE